MDSTEASRQGYIHTASLLACVKGLQERSVARQRSALAKGQMEAVTTEATRQLTLHDVLALILSMSH